MCSSGIEPDTSAQEYFVKALCMSLRVKEAEQFIADLEKR